MSAKKSTSFALFISFYCISLSCVATISHSLGWLSDPTNNCGGYYWEESFPLIENDTVLVNSDKGFFSAHGTSILEKNVLINRSNQQILADKAFLYRDPHTWKLYAAELRGDISLREPNTLIRGSKGQFYFKNDKKFFQNIIYRTVLDGRRVLGPRIAPNLTIQPRRILGLTAWGEASLFSQNFRKIYEFTDATYSTCPPNAPSWQVKGKHIVLNKNTGRGYATHARLYVKNIPILYMPYLNFSIDKQRKTGFLWPTPNLHNKKWGVSLLIPYYFNLAPNYDLTSTTGLLKKRGLLLGEDFRYLSSTSNGFINFTLIPHDSAFGDFKRDIAKNSAYAQSTSPTIQAEFNRLMKDSLQRSGLVWRDDSIFNDHWSSHVDFNYASDDYYLKDFGNNLNETTANQLLQEGELYYKGLNWNFIGRLQAYQTLHPIQENLVENNYRRFPQLILNADYPDQRFGLEYFINTEFTHFDIRNTPGTTTNLPIGNRINIQPGLNLPIFSSYAFINPRLQLALTQYQLYQITPTHTPGTIQRAIPIFDVAFGLAFNRNTQLFGNAFNQTLEPQLYYAYIPYHNQNAIPVFDTNVYDFVYDQIFTYNRFTGIDRIGDANQIGWGVTSRLIDEFSGLEKARLRVGSIVYFQERRVTLCTENCTDNPSNDYNHFTMAPLLAEFSYHLNPLWLFGIDAQWSTTTKQLSETHIKLHYQPDEDHILNLGFTYSASGNPFTGMGEDSSTNNLESTDISFAWPLMNNFSAVGRWTEDWHTQNLQNILYGLQYDTCCWSIRALGGKTFLGLNNNKPQYNNTFIIQFDLKGLGNIGTGDPRALLSTITGYTNKFGQEF